MDVSFRFERGDRVRTRNRAIRGTALAFMLTRTNEKMVLVSFPNPRYHGRYMGVYGPDAEILENWYPEAKLVRDAT